MGVEVLLALATGGADNVARRTGQAGAKMAKAGKLVKIGPFPVHAIDEMVDLAKTLSKPAIKTENKPAIIEIPADKPKPKTNTQPKADKTPDSNDKPEAESKPKPAPKIIKEKYGSNEAKWTVDEQGRPISVEAKLDSTYNTERSSAKKNLQQSVGGDSRLTDDDGGHVIGHRFMSDQGEKNLFPQNSNFNRSGYKKMENEWADWTDEGYEVKLKVDLHPPGSDRPTDIISNYEVFDPKTGDIVFDRRHKFNNAAGEAFERVSKSDMSSFRN